MCGAGSSGNGDVLLPATYSPGTVLKIGGAEVDLVSSSLSSFVTVVLY
jgi:hypothetical protein